MTHNLTENQQALARWLVAERDAGRMTESFLVTTDRQGNAMLRESIRFPFTDEGARVLRLDCPSFTNAALDALVAEGMLMVEGSIETVRRFTFRRRLLDAVRNNFRTRAAMVPAPLAKVAAATALPAPVQSAEPPVFSPAAAAPLVTAPGAVAPVPRELAHSLERLRRRHPDTARLGCLLAPASNSSVCESIVRTIRKTAALHGLTLLGAHEQPFHADPWENVRTLLHGCSFAIAVYEHGGGEEPGVNMGAAVGYMLAMDRPLLLLRGLKAAPQPGEFLPGLCEVFDEDLPARSIPEVLERWLKDSGVADPSLTEDVTAGA